MNYVVFRQKNRGIPTIIVIVLSLIFAGTVYMFLKDQKPQAIKLPAFGAVLEKSVVGNVRDNNISVYWKTNVPSQGYLLYGTDESNISQKAYDTRDTRDALESRMEHYISLQDVQPSTRYYYYIVTDGKKIGQTPTDPFQVETAAGINDLFSQEPMHGILRRSNRQLLSEAFVLVTVNGGESLITMTKHDGSFILGPCCLKKGSRKDVFIPHDEDDVTITVLGGAEESQYTYPYTFMTSGSELVLNESINAIEETIDEAEVLKEEFLMPARLVEKLNDIDVVYPRSNAVIPDSKPLYKGVGVPGENVKGRIEPDGKLFNVAVKEDGSWTYMPSTDLEPGPHELTIKTSDRKGELVSIIREFTILKSGEAVLGESTPSATLTPSASISPTQAPTSAPTLAPTQGPTSAPTLGVTPTVAPTTQPTGPSTIPTKPPPVSGNNILPFASASIALIMVGWVVVRIIN